MLVNLADTFSELSADISTLKFPLPFSLKQVDEEAQMWSP